MIILSLVCKFAYKLVCRDCGGFAPLPPHNQHCSPAGIELPVATAYKNWVAVICYYETSYGIPRTPAQYRARAIPALDCDNAGDA